MLSTLMLVLENAGPIAADGEAAYAAVKQFLASQAGQDLEGHLSTLFTHVATPGAAVVAEPAAAAPGVATQSTFTTANKR